MITTYNNDKHESHRKHRNVLYSLVIVLAIIQIISFIIMSLQISKLNYELDSEIQKSKSDLKSFSINYTNEVVGQYDFLYQQNFLDITKVLSRQQQDFEQQINTIKASTQDDFSSVIEEAVKSVVAVSTDKSIGTGFIISPDGYIVTNYHIISRSENKVSIKTYDQETIVATFIGKDELRDVALLKVNGEYSSLELADSSSLQAGKKVIAIGNPLGLSLSVTEGIISALERAGPNGLSEYIQTDVSLNPGNSGGPLIDTEGKVVGINNFKIGGAESLGFALESDSIKESVNKIANQTLIN